MKRILVKYTSRSRPENFERGLKSIIDNANELNELRVLVSLDSDDDKLKEYEDLLQKYYDKVFIKVYIGKSNNKIDAINRDIDTIKFDWHILVNFSDDQIFTVKGWDDIVRHWVKRDTFVHFPDPNQSTLATMSIMDREYYERFKYIYHPDYQSVYCDNEAQEVAIKLQRYIKSDFCIFDHLHPAWGKAPNDRQYLLTEHPQVHHRDKLTYERRKANNYDLLPE